MPLPRRLGNFELIGKLGQGGMGAVFKARQISMDRIVALKVLPPKLARSEAYIVRFRREAHSAGQINHPRLVNAIEIGEDQGYHYIAMEYVEGPTLKQVLREHGPLPEAQAIAHMLAVAEALQAAHERGFVHRDVKPDNILIGRDGAKLADLGLAKPMDGEADVTLAGRVIGTAAYMSPEQSRGEACDGRSDLYSLGATFWHLLTGELLFQGPTSAAIQVKHVTEAPRPLRSIAPSCSPSLEAVLAQLLEKDPARRFATAAELIAALEVVRGGGTWRPPVRLQLATRILVAGIVLGAVALFGVLAWPSGEDRSVSVAEQTPDSPASATTSLGQSPSGSSAPVGEPPSVSQPDPPDEIGHAEQLASVDQADESIAGKPASDPPVADGAEEKPRDLGAVPEDEGSGDQLDQAWTEHQAAIEALLEAGDFDGARARLAEAAEDGSRHDGFTKLRRAIEQRSDRAMRQFLSQLRRSMARGKVDRAHRQARQWAGMQDEVGRVRFEATYQHLVREIEEQREAAARYHRQVLLHDLREGLLPVLDHMRQQQWDAARTGFEELGRRKGFKPFRGDFRALAAAMAGPQHRDAYFMRALAERVGENVGITFGEQLRRYPLVEVDEGQVHVQVGDRVRAYPIDRLTAETRTAILDTWKPEDAADRLFLLLEALVVDRSTEAIAPALEPLDSAIVRRALQDLGVHLASSDAEQRARTAYWALLRDIDRKLTHEHAQDWWSRYQDFRSRYVADVTNRAWSDELQLRAEPLAEYLQVNLLDNGDLSRGNAVGWSCSADTRVVRSHQEGPFSNTMAFIPKLNETPLVTLSKESPTTEGKVYIFSFMFKRGDAQAISLSIMNGEEVIRSVPDVYGGTPNNYQRERAVFHYIFRAAGPTTRFEFIIVPSQASGDQYLTELNGASLTPPGISALRREGVLEHGDRTYAVVPWLVSLPEAQLLAEALGARLGVPPNKEIARKLSERSNIHRRSASTFHPGGGRYYMVGRMWLGLEMVGGTVKPMYPRQGIAWNPIPNQNDRILNRFYRTGDAMVMLSGTDAVDGAWITDSGEHRNYPLLEFDTP